MVDDGRKEWIALLEALNRGDRETVDVLLPRLGPDARDPESGLTLLHVQLDFHFEQAGLESLLARGADPNLRCGPLQETALHVAVRRRRGQVVKPLLNAGAQIGARTVGGMTAWRHALRRPFPELVELLAGLGADSRMEPSDQLAVLLLAEEDGKAKAMLDADAALADPKLIRGWPEEEARLLPDLASQGKIQGVKMLLARGASIEDRGDQHRLAPLGWVAHGSAHADDAGAEAYAQCARLLLAAGAQKPDPDDPLFTGAAASVRAVLDDAY